MGRPILLALSHNGQRRSDSSDNETWLSPIQFKKLIAMQI